MVPVIRALQTSQWARCVVVVTAQHRDMLDQMLTRFGLTADYDLNLMQRGQSPDQVLARMLPELAGIIAKEQPYAVLAQGDTTTVFGAALAAFHGHVPFGHIEAGLRTHNLAHPYPEEGYRQMVSRITRWHFAPTAGAALALRQEGIAEDCIHVVGNTCIDTLLQTVASTDKPATASERLLLLTAHRRENFGQPLKAVFAAVLQLLKAYPDVHALYPVHPNPQVHQLAHDMLGAHPRVRLVPPLDYFEFVTAMQSAHIILTDSGGVQEEAPALGKPVLVLRQTTERPEPVAEGAAELVGTDANNIVHAVSRLLDDEQQYANMARPCMPYGNGTAAQQIVNLLQAACV
ncbi:UDP-N-acetylglucosamine 2-epimerase [gamma proteobacterium HdN1]|nr:UDP-N-acetylglucosamine 2-epimerase [gamma proteobacterium HdN1]